MPIYDYLCSNCGALTEVIHGISAPGPRFCPACGAEDTLRKALVAPAVHFKGSGWAKKDRSAARKAPAKPDSGTEVGAGKTGTSGGDASPSTGSTSPSQSGSTSSDSTTTGGSASTSSDAAAG